MFVPRIQEVESLIHVLFEDQPNQDGFRCRHGDGFELRADQLVLRTPALMWQYR